MLTLSVFASLSHLSQRERQGALILKTDTADYPAVPVNGLVLPALSGGGSGHAFGVSAFSINSVTIFRYRGVSTR